DSIVGELVREAKILPISRQTAGAACSALLAIGDVEKDAELLIVNASDQLVEIDFVQAIAQFKEKSADAGVFTFEALHPRYSYVRVDEHSRVVEAAEKRPISRQACAGYYWFAKAADFFDAAFEMILKDDHLGGQFFIAPVLNQLILKQKNVVTNTLMPEQYFPIKIAGDVATFERAVRSSSTSERA
ncbi:MAG: glycosyl transferase family 2, partial [Alphaproteobacteria bacterium]